MPLKTDEEKKNAWKIVLAQVKVFGVTVALGLGTIWGIVEIYLEDYVKEVATTVIEERSEKQSFREVLGEKLKVPADEVPYHVCVKLTQVDSLVSEIKRFEGAYVPFLEHQMNITVIYRYLDDIGDEWWHGYDNRDYRVNYDNGVAWVVYHGFRKDI